ncbi:MAG: NAD(P)H-hydrate dehydratase [Phycisphaeraceae bacterium]|nr:MAG: NAD(P)H-hydrate dehydratase [Phycisphaeraceae bacterium]
MSPDTRDDHPLPLLPQRDSRGHKGDFGTVAIVGGRVHADITMLGGPAFSALAALRSGAGLVRLALPAPILNAALTLAPSATGVALPIDHEREVVPREAAVILDGLLAEASCLAIGPGLGLGAAPRALTLRAVMQEETPVVVDADALNNLAETPELQRDFHAHAIITPHPGEYRRLARSLEIDEDPVSPDARPAAAERLAQFLGCIVVLKGAGTVVSDGHRTWVDDAHNAALATAGTGDVLTGIIAALVAQHHRDPLIAGERSIPSERRGGLSLFDCARIAVRAHARAADAWTARTGASSGLLAMDLVDELPGALQSLRTADRG